MKTQNTIALLVSFQACTYTKPNRIKIFSPQFEKRVFYSFNIDGGAYTRNQAEYRFKQFEITPITYSASEKEYIYTFSYSDKNKIYKLLKIED